MLYPDCLQLFGGKRVGTYRMPSPIIDLQDKKLRAVIIDITTLPTGEVHCSRWGPADL